LNFVFNLSTWVHYYTLSATVDCYRWKYEKTMYKLVDSWKTHKWWQYGFRLETRRKNGKLYRN